MTLSPKKYVSNYTSNTAQRGVEAKEIDLGNTHLDLDMSVSTHCPAGSSASPPARSTDETGSYLQVVVEKHHRKRSPARAAAAAQTSARLPAASSPLAHAQLVGGAGGDRGVFVLPHSLLLACSTAAGDSLCPALQQHTYYTRGAALVDAATSAPECAPDAPDARDPPDPRDPRDPQKKNNTWKIFRDFGTEKLCDNEPARVEVYYFEHGSGAFLATCGGAAPTRVERAGRRGARVAGALLAELLAAPALLLALPGALLLHVARAALRAARSAVAGLVQTASDYALKPALALTFNALLQPLLVFCANVARGLRDALRPLAGALGDALEPAARLLAAVRLVDVRHYHPAPV